MKEKYFTSASIAGTAEGMLSRIKQAVKLRDIKLNAGTSALLVLDMQKYFFDKASHALVPSGEAIISRIKELGEQYVKKGYPVIYTKHLNTAMDARLMAVWWNDLIEEKNSLSGIIDELDVSKGTLLIKSQYDAFYNTELKEILEKRGVRQVIICGVMTHLCCETTARSAFVRGFEVFFPVDGTAAYNRAFHMAALLNLSHGFAVPVLMKDMLEAVKYS